MSLGFWKRVEVRTSLCSLPIHSKTSAILRSWQPCGWRARRFLPGIDRSAWRSSNAGIPSEPVANGTAVLALFVLLHRLVAELLELPPNPLADLGPSLAGADADMFAEFAHSFARRGRGIHRVPRGQVSNTTRRAFS